jgi:hypothetical protein
MTHRIMAAAVVVMSLMPVPAPGQTPDLQGHWQHDAVLAGHSVEDGRNPANDIITGEYLTGRVSRSGERNPTVIVEPADGRIPYQPNAAVKRDEFLANFDTPTKLEHIDPHARSLLDGVPRANYDPVGELQIVQVPGYVLILYESGHAFRAIPMDGRPRLSDGVQLFMGDSRGRWEGQTLVIDVTNFNDRTWFDTHGTFHSDALHVVERWTLVSPDQIAYEVTIEDPKVFTSPWKVAFTINRRIEKEYEQWEDARIEGDRNVEQMLAGGRREKEAGRTGIHEHRRAR